MKLVVTLVAPVLSHEHVAAARAALPGDSMVDWLGEGEACDLYPAAGDTDSDAVLAALRAALAGEAVDIVCQPDGAQRRKSLLLADMDSTIITVECIDEMADMLGLKAEVAAITEQAMRGEIDFPAALRARARLLRGLPLSALDTVYADRVRLSPGAATLVGTMRAHGAASCLVSGGFTYFTERVAAAAGFDSQRANRLVVADASLTGEVEEPILDSASKLACLRELSGAHGLAAAQTLAVGDGANDVPMLQAAGLGVAYRAKPVTAAAAAARIDHADLSALLYLQGYRRSAFVTPPAQ